VRLLMAAAPAALGLGDQDALRLHAGPQARRIARSGTPPHPGYMLRVHGVLPERVDDGLWVHTHGLQRAGFPDLEVLDVPFRRSDAAAQLLSHCVELYLGSSLPPRGKPFEVVRGHPIAWLPLREALALRPGLRCGGLAERRMSREHGGYRAVLVCAERERAPGGRWRAPLGALRAIDEEDLVVGVSAAEAQRRSRKARERWPDFLSLHDAHGKEAGWEFLLQVHWPALEGEAACGEYLWFRLVERRDGRLLGRLVSDPVAIPDLQPGSVHDCALEAVSDWEVRGPSHTLRPDDPA
jgi:hypothetical protein